MSVPSQSNNHFNPEILCQDCAFVNTWACGLEMSYVFKDSEENHHVNEYSNAVLAWFRNIQPIPGGWLCLNILLVNNSPNKVVLIYPSGRNEEKHVFFFK